jgi:ribosomal protein S12 methylthiotransferase
MDKIALISHGCAKNLVDSELMLGMLVDAGYEITLDEEQAQIVIINTCSFIHDAEKESIRSILEIINRGKKVIIAGCLPQKHKKELEEALPEAAAFLGTSDIGKIVQTVNSLNSQTTLYDVCDRPEYAYPEGVKRQQITLGASSYIKIAEGCNYQCGYCIIPKLRGKYISRPIENIVKEAEELAQKGVTEIILIAQDTTAYGKDLYGKYALAELLKKLNDIENIEWIRVMYTYPSTFTDELIEAFDKLDKVVKYIDIPLQHSEKNLLKAMNRPAFDYSELIKKLRKGIKNVAIRSTFIVGYPTETDEQFEHLYNFIKEARFDKLGVFEYSREKETPSYSMKPQVSAKIKKQRKKRLMELQQKISFEINQSLVGEEISCIVETIDTKGTIVARSYRDAPEIDGYVYVKTEKALLPGDIETIRITSASEYDLYGETLD